jgi:hypothetical protein
MEVVACPDNTHDKSRVLDAMVLAQIEFYFVPQQFGGMVVVGVEVEQPGRGACRNLLEHGMLRVQLLDHVEQDQARPADRREILGVVDEIAEVDGLGSKVIHHEFGSSR